MPTLTELKLTKKQRAKKVCLAKDVLRQLDAKRFKPVEGRYFKGFTTKDYDENDGFWEDDLHVFTSTELQKELKSLEICEVCARGALFVAAIERYDSVSGVDFSFEGLEEFDEDGNGLPTMEDQYFTRQELLELEGFFELVDKRIRERHLLSVHTSAEDRMRLSMNHIIASNGEVDLEKLVDEALAKIK